MKTNNKRENILFLKNNDNEDDSKKQNIIFVLYVFSFFFIFISAVAIYLIEIENVWFQVKRKEYVYSYYPMYSYSYENYVENESFDSKNVFVLGENNGGSSFTDFYFTLADYKSPDVIKEFEIEKNRVNFIRDDKDTISQIKITEEISYLSVKRIFSKDTLIQKRELLNEVDFLIPKNKKIILIDIGVLRKKNNINNYNYDRYNRYNRLNKYNSYNLFFNPANSI